MEINWERVFRSVDRTGPQKRKFEVLPGLLPWSTDLEDNLWATTEWLYRSGRKEEVSFCDQPVLNPIRDGWYRSEVDDGLFLHVCYPEELISFRRQYESLMFCIHDQEQDPEGRNMLKEMHENCQYARSLLWSAWSCMGRDGDRYQPDAPPGELTAIPVWSEWPRRWNKKCARCCEELPKSLKMWVKLQHSKLSAIG